MTKKETKAFEWDRKTCLRCGVPLEKEYVYNDITTIYKFCDVCFLEIWSPDYKRVTSKNT